MSKKNQVKQAKPLNTKRVAIISAAVVLVVLSLVLILTLSGNKKPVTITNSDAAYVSVDKYTVTNGELYEVMKSQGGTIFTNILTESLFATQPQVDFATNSFASKQLDDTINTSLYGATNVEDLEKYYGGDDNETARLMKIHAFVDSLFLVNPKVNRQELVDFFNNNTTFSNYHEQPALKEQYLTTVKQYIYAQTKLNEKITEDLASTDEKVVEAHYNALLTNFKANKFVKYDVDLLMIRFINDAEAKQFLRYFGLISDSNGNWFQLPVLPTKEDGTQNGKLLDGLTALTSANIDTEASFADLKTIMQDIKVDDVLYENLYEQFKATDEVPAHYYETLYSKSSSKLTKLTALEQDDVLELFVGIQQLLSDDNTLTADDLKETHEYDDLTTKLGATLRNYAYNTLRSANKDNEEGETKKAFSTLRTGSGTSRYLVYRFNDANVYGDFFDKEDDDERTDLEIFTEKVTSTHKDLYETLLESYKESTLTSSYVTTKVGEYLEDLKVDIYDPTLRMLYSVNNEYTGSEKSHKTLVAKWSLGDITGELTADQLYARVEPIYGTNMALDLIIKKALLDPETGYYAKLTAEELKDFDTQYESILTNFAADAFAQNGYPASLGREKFLKLIFDADTKDDALINGYVLPRLKELFGVDYETHYNTNIFNNLADLVNSQYDNFASITVSHLLVFMDKNYDGNYEDPNEYFKDNPTEQVAFEAAVVELVDLVNSLVKYKSNYVAGIQQIIADYESIGRAELESDTIYDNRLNQFIKFRKLGISLKYEALSAPITNSSNFLHLTTGRLDDVFYDRAMLIYNEQYKNNADFDVNTYAFPYVDYLNEGLEVADLEQIRSAFGYHIIIAGNTSGNSNVFGERPSAKYTDESTDYHQLVIGDETLNPLNETDLISASQVRYYLESLRNPDLEDNDGLPTSIQAAFTTFFNPIKTIYDNTYHQRHLYFKFVEGLGTLTFTDTTKQANYDVVKEINQNQFFNYLNTNGTFADSQFEALYGTWFETLSKTA